MTVHNPKPYARSLGMVTVQLGLGDVRDPGCSRDTLLTHAHSRQGSVHPQLGGRFSAQRFVCDGSWLAAVVSRYVPGFFFLAPLGGWWCLTRVTRPIPNAPWVSDGRRGGAERDTPMASFFFPKKKTSHEYRGVRGRVCGCVRTFWSSCLMHTDDGSRVSGGGI